MRLEKISMPRKILLTAIGILYAVSIIGNVSKGIGIPALLGLTLFFLAVTFVALLWVN